MAGVMDYLNKNPAWQALAQKFPDARLIFTAAEEAALAGAPWDQTRFASEISNTQWYRSTPGPAREYLFKQAFDPASATMRANQMALKILNQSQTLGLHLSLQQGAVLADAAIAGEWDDARIAQEIVGQTKYGPNMKLGAGTVSAAETHIRGIAGDYGLNISGATAYDWGSRIAEGQSNTDSFSEYAKQQAKITHPYWEKQLDQGMTVRQLADPYLQAAGQLLEINPATINLADHRWTGAFTTRAKDGTATPMSQTDWTHKLMTDPQYGWDHTQNAKQAAFGVVDSLRQTFGAS